MRSSRRSSFAIACSLLAATACAACSGDVGAGARPNVVLVCLDTVRADHLTPYGYTRHETSPFLDELGREGLLFERAYATAGWTKPSVPSFLTGTFPIQHGVYEGSARGKAGAVTDVLPESATTLAEVFSEHGYRTAAFIKNAQLKRGNGFEQGFDLYHDDAGDARSIRWSALDWLDENAGEEPFFLYLHFLDAHWPYPVADADATRFVSAEAIAPFRGGDSRALRDAINAGARAFGDAERAALEGLYDGSIRALDEELRRLDAGLAARGLASDTIVCVLADHGEEFGEHGRIGHGHGLYETLLHVPWILRGPGIDPRRAAEPVSLVDLGPTLLAAAGLPVPVAMEGVNRLRSQEARPILAEHKAPDRYQQTLLIGPAKLLRVFEPSGDAGGAPPPIARGERWEVEFERDGDRLVATELKPRFEDAGDPAELKGELGNLRADGFDLGPFEVGLTAGTKRQFVDGVLERPLAEGDLVKVKGEVERSRWLAERLKVYEEGASAPLEVRAPVEDVDWEARRVRLVGRWFELTASTRIKGTGEDRKRRLDRRAILAYFRDGGDQDLALVRSELFDLAADPGELSPRAPSEQEDHLLDARLERFTRDLASRAYFAGDEQRVLSGDTLDSLRDLGYVR
ncbi:MAG TPA: hypothetical protein ENJ09_03795 [Planctomycetes bacterium]|nr:hypothetical protein [Planctomycetota bacterium]